MADEMQLVGPDGKAGKEKPKPLGRPPALAIPRSHLGVRITKTTFAGKKASERDCVRWVLDNFLVEDVTPEDAPSAFAWTYLCLARDRERPKVSENLFSDTIERLLPTKTQLETSEKFVDDGRTQMQALDRLIVQAKGDAE